VDAKEVCQGIQNKGDRAAAAGAAMVRKINSRPLRGLYIWPLHSWWPSDALAKGHSRTCYRECGCHL